MDSIAAKQFLISRVIEESELEGVPLSEIEKKMLHFTEVHPSLPDIYEANAEFERDYDSDEYETKVARLLRNARERDKKGSTNGDRHWQSALDALKKEDHYILVMADQAFGAGLSSSGGSRIRDLLIYIAVAIGVFVLLILASVWRSAR